MSDPAGEIREALERLIDQRLLSLATDMGLSPGSRAIGPVIGSSGDLTFDTSFATGYDGTDTITPFMRGVSIWGGDDVWTE